MPEMQNIEWKVKWKDEYLEWICGFANAQGGKIYIGCDDNGHVVGLDNTRRLLEDIPNKIRSAMSIVVDVNLLRQDGKEYIEITGSLLSGCNLLQRRLLLPLRQHYADPLRC